MRHRNGDPCYEVLRHGLPTSRRKRIEIVLVGHRRQAGEHVAQVSRWLDAAALARDDDRVDDRGTLAGIRMTDEEPVLLVMASSP